MDIISIIISLLVCIVDLETVLFFVNFVHLFDFSQQLFFQLCAL